MDFISVTITDLNESIKQSAYASIKSYLKYHKNKLIVYIIGDEEFLLKDERIEIIRIPKKDYNISRINPCGYFNKIMNILVEKTMIFSKHENFMFFENDVFFFDNMKSVWSSLENGVSGHINSLNFINMGLVFVKNHKFNFSLNDVLDFFENKVIKYPDEEFLSNQIDREKVHYLSTDVNILSSSFYYQLSSVKNIKSMHCCGEPKPPHKPKNISKNFLLLYRRIYEFFY